MNRWRFNTITDSWTFLGGAPGKRFGFESHHLEDIRKTTYSSMMMMMMIALWYVQPYGTGYPPVGNAFSTVFDDTVAPGTFVCQFASPRPGPFPCPRIHTFLVHGVW
jgi:hypothetical protein